MRIEEIEQRANADSSMRESFESGSNVTVDREQQGEKQ
jgi:hypothetical protein